VNAFSAGLGLLAGLMVVALAIRNAVRRAQLERVIFESDTPAGKRFDLALLIAIVLSVLLVALESDPWLRGQHRSVFEALELLFSCLFSLEYLLRLLCSRSPGPMPAASSAWWTWSRACRRCSPWASRLGNRC
jgi:voltage-gated potassium channel